MRKPGLNWRNEEYALVPKRSHYGQVFKSNLAGRIIANPAPVFTSRVRDGGRGFRDRFGVVVNTVPYPTPLIARSMLNRYSGQLPIGEQTVLPKPKPWSVFVNGR